jgi:hypothetical protein
MIHEASEESPSDSDRSSCRCGEHDEAGGAMTADDRETTTADPAEDEAEL